MIRGIRHAAVNARIRWNQNIVKGNREIQESFVMYRARIRLSNSVEYGTDT